MSLAGITIVISGLAVLATIISQLHKIVDWLERPKKAAATGADKMTDTQRALIIPERMPEDIDAVAGIYRALADQLEAPFELFRLHAIGAEHNLPHVHISLRALRDAGHLIPDGEGGFFWQP